MLDDPGAGLSTREERRAARLAAWARPTNTIARATQRAARIARAQAHAIELRDRMVALVETRLGADEAARRRERLERGRP